MIDRVVRISFLRTCKKYIGQNSGRGQRECGEEKVCPDPEKIYLCSLDEKNL